MYTAMYTTNAKTLIEIVWLLPDKKAREFIIQTPKLGGGTPALFEHLDEKGRRRCAKLL
ncbi:unnamed protein product [Pylaiella littoralis]